LFFYLLVNKVDHKKNAYVATNSAGVG